MSDEQKTQAQIAEETAALIEQRVNEAVNAANAAADQRIADAKKEWEHQRGIEHEEFNSLLTSAEMDSKVARQTVDRLAHVVNGRIDVEALLKQPGGMSKYHELKKTKHGRLALGLEKS